MIGKEEILGFAREVGLDPNVVERDNNHVIEALATDRANQLFYVV